MGQMGACAGRKSSDGDWPTGGSSTMRSMRLEPILFERAAVSHLRIEDTFGGGATTMRLAEFVAEAGRQ